MRGHRTTRERVEGRRRRWSVGWEEKVRTHVPVGITESVIHWNRVMNDPENGTAWYEDGLQFQCTMCGNCCTGPPGAVWIEQREAAALAASLGMSVPAFLRQYARRLNGRWSLQERRTEHGLDCIFLDRETLPGKAVCSVYETRPAQCSAWPFWKENLASPEAWESARRKTPCPGIGCGPRITVDRIRILRDSVPGSSGDE